MPSPSSSLATHRPDLETFEEFQLELDRAGYIGSRVMPVAEVGKQAGNFGILPLEQLLQTHDTHRAPNGAYPRGRWEFEPATYATEEHGWEEPVDDREATMYSDYFVAEQVSTARAMQFVLSNYEIRVATAIFNATTFTSYTTAITNEWDDAANATPLVDVEAAVQSVYSTCGLWPNSLIINRKVFRNLRNVDEILDRVKYSGYDDVKAGNMTVQMLSAAFDLNVIVAGGSKNTANIGQTPSLSSIWSDEYAMVGLISDSQDFRQPCLGRTFHWSEDGSAIAGRVESYRDETVRGDVQRVRMDTDEKMLYAKCGHLLSNVTTI